MGPNGECGEAARTRMGSGVAAYEEKTRLKQREFESGINASTKN
jgi:hypothetical protein